MLKTVGKKKFKNKIEGFHFYIEFPDKGQHHEMRKEVEKLILDKENSKKFSEEYNTTDLYEYWDYLKTFLRKEYSIFFTYRPIFKPKKRMRLLPQSHNFSLTHFAPDLTYNDLIVIQEALEQYETWQLTEREQEYFEKTVDEIQHACVKTAIF